MITEFTKVLENLAVYPDHMQENLDATRGLIFSQEVLLALTKKGMKREDAYRLVQEKAMNVWQNGKDFKTLLMSSEEVSKTLSGKELDELFDAKRSLKQVDYIFNKVGLN